MNTTRPVTVMMTGGHITPAHALIEAMREAHPDWHIVFVGRRVALEGSGIVSEEERIIRDLHIPFLALTTGRFKREATVGALVSFLKVPVGLVQSFLYLGVHRPSIVVSFGGYVALPLVIAAWILRIPSVTHEQTMRPGLANRIIARCARAVCVNFPEAARHFSSRARIYVTGLPVRRDVLVPPSRAVFPLLSSLPLLFIVGGSTGSVSVNDVVFAALFDLIRTFQVVHQVGRLSMARAQSVHATLPEAMRKRYVPVPYVTSETYSYLLHKATILVGRAGANTVTEAGLLGKVALFVPLPWAGNNEQHHNANVLKNAGSSLIIDQKHLTPETLLQGLERLMRELPERRQKAKTFSSTLPHDGAEKMLEVIERHVRPEPEP